LFLLQTPERLEEMAHQNFSAALQMSMPQIIREYIRTFDMQQRLRMLKAFSKLRRSRRWAPGRSWSARQLGKKLHSWRPIDRGDRNS
jgi:hypothetical protein